VNAKVSYTNISNRSGVPVQRSRYSEPERTPLSIPH